VLAPFSHTAVLTWLCDPASLAITSPDDVAPRHKAPKLTAATAPSLGPWFEQFNYYCQRREQRLDDADHTLQQLFQERSDDWTRHPSADPLALAPFFSWLAARLEWQLLQAQAQDEARAASRPNFSNTFTDSLFQSVVKSRVSSDHLRELRPGLAQTLQDVTDDDLRRPLTAAGMQDTNLPWDALIEGGPATEDHLRALLQANRRAVSSDYSHSEYALLGATWCCLPPGLTCLTRV
jgi:hypothetical protein